MFKKMKGEKLFEATKKWLLWRNCNLIYDDVLHRWEQYAASGRKKFFVGAL